MQKRYDITTIKDEINKVKKMLDQFFITLDPSINRCSSITIVNELNLIVKHIEEMVIISKSLNT